MDILTNFYQIKKKFKEVEDEFLNFINGKRLIIHNAEFDISHLNNELSILGKKKLSNEIIDTLVLAREKYPGSSVSLDALCKRYNIDNSKRTHHTALIDCELLAKVYINLIDQKEPLFNFSEDDHDIIKNSKTNVNYFKKIIKPSSDELSNHQKYLEKSKEKFF